MKLVRQRGRSRARRRLSCLCPAPQVRPSLRSTGDATCVRSLVCGALRVSVSARGLELYADSAWPALRSVVLRRLPAAPASPIQNTVPHDTVHGPVLALPRRSIRIAPTRRSRVDVRCCRGRGLLWCQHRHLHATAGPRSAPKRTDGVVLLCVNEWVAAPACACSNSKRGQARPGAAAPRAAAHTRPVAAPQLDHSGSLGAHRAGGRCGAVPAPRSSHPAAGRHRALAACTRRSHNPTASCARALARVQLSLAWFGR